MMHFVQMSPMQEAGGARIGNVEPWIQSLVLQQASLLSRLASSTVRWTEGSTSQGCWVG